MCIVDAETAFRKEMDGWAQVLNGRPMIFTESGAATMPSEHKLPSVMWSQAYQNEYLDMNHNVFDSYDFVPVSYTHLDVSKRPIPARRGQRPLGAVCGARVIPGGFGQQPPVPPCVGK